MWWDERSVALDVEVAPAPSTTAAGVDVGPDGDRRLLATVDLEDPYLRDLVLEAFASSKSRSERWRVVRADGVRGGGDEEEAPAATEEGEGPPSTDEEDSVPFLAPHPLVSQSRFHWGEYERIDWDRVSAEKTMASSYAVRKGLTRKAQLAFGVKKWVSKRPNSPLAGCFPETHVLQVDDVEYIDEALCDLPEIRDADPGDRTRWIVKPSVTNRAAGVAVVDGVEGLREALEAIPEMREWVVQRYVDDPLLLPRREREGERGGRGGGGRADVGGESRSRSSPSTPSRSPSSSPRKWHVRAYALCVGALSVYSFEGGMLALCARKGYEGAPIGDLDAHLTNTCRRRDEVESDDGDRGESDGDGGESDGDGGESDGDGGESDGDGDDRILLLSEIPELLCRDSSSLSLAEATRKTEELASRISTLIGETFAAVSSELTFFALPSAFELFGFDFLVDERWNPWLLEANADPDVGASGDRLRDVIRELVDGVLRLTADEIARGSESGGSGDDGGPPCSREWKLVYRADSGRQGAGFRVG